VVFQLETQSLFGLEFNFLALCGEHSTPAGPGADDCANGSTFLASGNRADDGAHSGCSAHGLDVSSFGAFCLKREGVRPDGIRRLTGVNFRQAKRHSSASFDTTRPFSLRDLSNHHTSFRSNQPSIDFQILSKSPLKFVARFILPELSAWDRRISMGVPAVTTAVIGRGGAAGTGGPT